MQPPPQLSPDGAYRWDGQVWHPVQPAAPPPPSATGLPVPPPDLPPPVLDPDRPGWLATGVDMPNLQAQAFAPVEQVVAYDGFAPARSEPAPAGAFSWPIAFSLEGGLSQLGVAGAIVVILMVLNTAIALNEPIGTGRWTVPVATLFVCVRRALRGRWLAVFLIGGTWLVCVGLIQARGGP